MGSQQMRLANIDCSASRQKQAEGLLRRFSLRMICCFKVSSIHQRNYQWNLQHVNEECCSKSFQLFELKGEVMKLCHSNFYYQFSHYSELLQKQAFTLDFEAFIRYVSQLRSILLLMKLKSLDRAFMPTLSLQDLLILNLDSLELT